MTWTTTLAVLHVALAAITTSHVALTKRDARSATLWVGIAWLSPIIGTALYSLFGINRIRRRARRTWATTAERIKEQQRVHDETDPDTDHLPLQLQQLAHLVGKIVSQPLQAGNRIELLQNGDEAYPAMCDAIQAARTSVTLATYLFQQDVVGERFVRALAKAVANGAEVRVLVDDAGSRYSFPRIFQSLKAAGIPSAAFHRRNRLSPKSTLNIRNHRKICVVDGNTAFTGGMNIQRAHVLAEPTKKPVQDVHFSVMGPVVRQLQEAFADDWLFATGESLHGEAWFPVQPAAGNMLARCIPEGPDSDLDKLRWTILAAIGAARKSIQIVTPYFLPDATIVAAINLACLRGVAVDIILPRYPNIPLMRWAVLGTLGQVLQHGGRAWFTPLPFDHSKLMLVDEEWTMLGSANWDVRSLRLNFELNLECYDRQFGREMARVIANKLGEAQPVTADYLRQRALPVRLRDGLARLFAPLL